MLRIHRVAFLFLMLSLAGCPALTQFLSRTVSCVADSALEGWLGSRLRDADWPAVREAPRAGNVLGGLITCGLEGLADAVSQASETPSLLHANGAHGLISTPTPARPREVRARACAQGPCESARERAAAVLVNRLPPASTAIPNCRDTSPEAVRWLKAALVKHPVLADDIMTTEYGRELESSLVSVASSDSPVASIALNAVTRHPSRCVAP